MAATVSDKINEVLVIVRRVFPDVIHRIHSKRGREVWFSYDGCSSIFTGYEIVHLPVNDIAKTAICHIAVGIADIEDFDDSKPF